MTPPYFAEHDVTLWTGEALAVLADLPDRSVDCVVTSPPYFGVRDYDDPGQLGCEPTVGEYVERLVERLDACRRVLTRTGTMWVNLGDSYSGRANGGPSVGRSGRGDHAECIPTRRNTITDAPYKSLLMVPARVAIEMTLRRWALRNRIVWRKTNGPRHPVGDRVINVYEEVYVFAAGPRYYFDLDAIRIPAAHPARPARAEPRKYANGDRPSRRGHSGGSPDRRTHPNGANPGDVWTVPADQPPAPDAKYTFRDREVGHRPADGARHTSAHPNGANPGDVWPVADDPDDWPQVWPLPTAHSGAAHLAVMPLRLAERCVQVGCPPGGTVLDPFSGAGTTAVAARRLGRRAIGVDLRADYHQIAVDRLGAPPLDLHADDGTVVWSEALL